MSETSFFHRKEPSAFYRSETSERIKTDFILARDLEVGQVFRLQNKYYVVENKTQQSLVCIRLFRGHDGDRNNQVSWSGKLYLDSDKGFIVGPESNLEVALSPDLEAELYSEK